MDLPTGTAKLEEAIMNELIIDLAMAGSPWIYRLPVHVLYQYLAGCRRPIFFDVPFMTIFCSISSWLQCHPSLRQQAIVPSLSVVV